MKIIKSFEERENDKIIVPDVVKTCEGWLNTIPNKRIRQRALFNMDQVVSKLYYNSLSDAIFAAFDFAKTKEGSAYWTNVVFELCFK